MNRKNYPTAITAAMLKGVSACVLLISIVGCETSTDTALFGGLLGALAYGEDDPATAGALAMLGDATVSASRNQAIERTGSSRSTSARSSSTADPRPTAKIYQARTEMDVYENGKRGLRVHANFEVWNAQGRKIVLIGSFYQYTGFFGGYKKLQDSDGKYRMTNGHVSAWRDLRPASNSVNYPDATIFLPYDQLDNYRWGKPIGIRLRVADHSVAPPRRLTSWNSWLGGKPKR